MPDSGARARVAGTIGAVGVDVERPRGALDDLLRDHHFFDPLEARQIEHRVEQDALHEKDPGRTFIGRYLFPLWSAALREGCIFVQPHQTFIIHVRWRLLIQPDGIAWLYPRTSSYLIVNHTVHAVVGPDEVWPRCRTLTG